MSSWAYQYYRNNLASNLQVVYDTIVKSWLAHEENIKLPPFLSKASIEETLLAIIKDHPEIFWINYNKCVLKRSLFETIIFFSMHYDNQTSHQLSKDAIAWKTGIVSKLPKCISDKDKAWLLFDYLARQVTYGNQSDPSSQSIIGPLSKNHTSICEGIAKSYKFLCDEANIPCIIIFGKVSKNSNLENHAWNIIETEHGYSHVDVTAELSHAHITGMATQAGFLHSDHEMQDYQWNRRHTPICF